MRCIRGSVTGRSDVADHVAASHLFALGQLERVAIEMRVVVAECSRAIEFINRQSAGAAGEELANRSIDCSENRRSSRSHDVQRLMNVTGTCVAEVVAKLASSNAGDGNRDRNRVDHRRRRNDRGMARHLGSLPRQSTDKSNSEHSDDPIFHVPFIMSRRCRNFPM